MLGLPDFGARVHVWPLLPNVQAGETPIADGGSFMLPEGREVSWSSFWHRRLLAGEIILHHPVTGVSGRIVSSAKPPVALGASAAAVDAAKKRSAAEHLRAAAEKAIGDAAAAEEESLKAEAHAVETGRQLVAKFAKAPAPKEK